jgi:8-oxo-dGTP pyrophosphatase MutT (NUDIX family)
VNEPGTWGIPGGRVDDGEEPHEAAIRELEEEAGYDGEVYMSAGPLMVYEKPGFAYFTFVGIVDDEFEPELNWESDEAGWFTLDELPEPLHFGVAELVAKGGPAIAEIVEKI